MMLSKSWISWNRDDPMISNVCGFQVVGGNLNFVEAVKTQKCSETLL